MFNLSYIVYALVGFNILLCVSVIVLYIKFGEVHNQITGIHSHMEGSQEPTEHLIKIWQARYKEYPEGSPKSDAYRARLVECGRFDGC